MFWQRLLFFSLLLTPISGVAAQEEIDFNIPLSTVWLALCTAMVFLMQAGFALLESGMVRAKNAINVIMKNYTDVCFGVMIYWVVGYGLMFGDKPYGFIGTSDFAPTDPSIRLIYQMMFAATAATVVSGAVAERMRYIPYVIASLFITGLIYPIFGSWVWSAGEQSVGWLEGMGFIDMAGSTVVHSVGGWCALAAIMVLGPRTGRYARDGSVHTIPGHNLTLVAVGGFILWFGWFGFNAGSVAGDADNVARILLNTQLAAGAGCIGALVNMYVSKRPILMTRLVNGVLGGLVSSCAGAATMDPGFAALTGFVAGNIVLIGWQTLNKYRLDDVVGAVPVHGMCGAWGTLAAGMFYAGDLFDLSRMAVQLAGVLAAFIWSFFVAYLVYAFINYFSVLRATKQHEQRGLDYTEHNEVGYAEFQNLITHQGKSR